MADVRFTDLEFDDAGPDDRPTLTASLVFAISVLGILAEFVYDYAVDPSLAEFQQYDWALAIAVVALSLGAVGEATRSAFDPRSE